MSCQGWVEGKDHFHWCAGNISPSATQKSVGFVCLKRFTFKLLLTSTQMAFSARKLHALVETILVAFDIPCTFNSRRVLAFLTPFLHNQCVHTSPGLLVLLPPLVHFVLMPELVRNHSGLLPHFSYFSSCWDGSLLSLEEMILNINQFSWISFLFKAISHKNCSGITKQKCKAYYE